MQNEIWKPIEGFEGYEISNLGRVRSWWIKGARKKSEKPRILKLRSSQSAILKSNKGLSKIFSVRSNLPKYFPVNNNNEG